MAPDRDHRLLARLKHLVVRHSHDTADRVDPALEASRAGMRCVAWSFAALLATALLQAGVVVVSGSVALLGDTLHARTDGFTSLAVVLGAAGVALGIPAADPVVGLLITAAILLVLRNASREVFRRLMDAV